ncbi:hypothetical protein CBI38_33965 (plasmid) [Rhodococcus oxybenzonivorans]|uniref:IrrE N-terminal-like domain-containing protein n=1 Tax=Rhodococcus oxybenzonivorans TaxID=1990687 RepID=A0A2S2C6B6_9NOCA|nr:hypothetical protein [Rhodococcus oxybenzonivorans]AWK76416.1 hypothetical protein CBI38_33965 [Rhodococcus oxybenzonivorans]
MAHRAAVTRAVDHLFRIAVGDEARSLTGMANALARDRGRPLLIHEGPDLPSRVFGQWVRNPDHDEIKYALWVHARERTIAHELGHMALGHVGRPAIELATDYLPPESHDLAKLMLQRDCTDTRSTEEADAEAFASLLLRRLKGSSRTSHNPAVRSRLDEALG